MVDFTKPVPFLYVAGVVIVVCLVIAAAIFLVNMKTKRLKDKD
jgi:signal transduction histidine kinase